MTWKSFPSSGTGVRIPSAQKEIKSDKNRLRHCALLPRSYAAVGLYAAAARFFILLPAAAASIRVSELFPRAAVSAHRVAGEEGVAVVYLGRAESVVD